MRVIDGSHGEGGGQVLRTSLALSAVTGEPVEVTRIRAGRRRPGLAPQHLTGVRAAAKVCSAKLSGARLRSQELTFVPQSTPVGGRYTFDVAQAAKGGSAGSVSLVLQTVLVPLAFADGPSQLTLRGGTHVAWSPPFDYLKRVYLPTLAQMGFRAKVNLRRWGWYPIGGGEVQAKVQPVPGGRASVAGLDLQQRGDLLRARGISATSNLPRHIRQRQARTAQQVLRSHGVNVRMDEVEAPSKGMGTVVFVWADFEHVAAGYTSLGERGKPAEKVAEEAALEMLTFRDKDAAVDRFLADQLILPAALARSPTVFATEKITQHLLTNAWVVEQFGMARVEIDGEEGWPGRVSITPSPAR
jgi:RNA 3'-terminal phosphate cyclase (ATP)